MMSAFDDYAKASLFHMEADQVENLRAIFNAGMTKAAEICQEQLIGENSPEDGGTFWCIDAILKERDATPAPKT
jgi:hypothetical protein